MRELDSEEMVEAHDKPEEAPVKEGKELETVMELSLDEGLYYFVTEEIDSHDFVQVESQYDDSGPVVAGHCRMFGGKPPSVLSCHSQLHRNYFLQLSS